MNQTPNKEKYAYGFAAEADGAEISALLEKVPFHGDISMCYARRPNAIVSAARDGDKSAIGIGRETATGKIVGAGICIINRMVVDGQPVNVAYLGGLRVESGPAGSIAKAYKIMEGFCRENNVRYTYTTILKDNLYAQKMFAKRRATMPDYISHSAYTVNVLLKNMKTKPGYTCDRASEADLEALHRFIRKESAAKPFFLDISMERLQTGFLGLTYRDFYLLKDANGEICSCGVLWEQSDYKQLIVKRYSLKYRILRTIAAPFAGLLGYPVPPKEGGIIRYATLSFVLAKERNPAYLRDFVGHVSRHVPKECSFFVYGCTDGTPEAAEVRKMKGIKYGSLVYLVDWDKNGSQNALLGRNLHIECGLL